MIKNIKLIIIVKGLSCLPVLGMKQDAKAAQESTQRANGLSAADIAEEFIYCAENGIIGSSSFGGMRLFLDKNHVDINARSLCDETALMKAAGNGHINAVQLLIDRGADPFIICNEQFCKGKRAKDFAQLHGQKQIVDLLDAYEKRWLQEKQKIVSPSNESAAGSQTAAASK